MPDIYKIKEKVMSFIRVKGPVLPVQISKEIEGNSIFAGAVLSELVSNKKILVSNAKVGGSPVYYVPEQKPKLEMLYKHLREKERKIYDILKKEKVLKDTILEPWQRVAVREIKDFSVKLTSNSTGEIFWKWYSVGNQDAERMIREKFIGGKKEVKKPELKKPEVQRKLADIPAAKEPVPEPKEQEPKPVDKMDISVDLVKSFFSSINSELVEEKQVRKNKDYEYLVKIDTSFGRTPFFVKFKDKKKINDAELSLAQSKAKSKNLSLVFLSTGELTKKAEKYSEAHHILFRKI